MKYLALRYSNQDYKACLLISYVMKFELQWWYQTLGQNIGITIVTDRNFVLEIFSDASLTAWGGFCNNRATHGFWHLKDIGRHINYLELLAAFNELRSFASGFCNCSILLRLDNITAIACINRMGSVRFKSLNDITRQIWLWCESKNIFVVPSYINTKQNIQADRESRNLSIETEYELSDSAFHEICYSFGTLSIDLFATLLNTKCRRYISWKPDQSSLTIDAFTVPWTGEFFYAFPPFNKAILKRFLRGIYNQKPSKPWYQITWDPQPVLVYLSKLHPLSDISRLQLSMKLVTLLALITGHRMQTLAHIRIQNMVRFPDRLEIRISDKVKTSSSKIFQPFLVIPYFRKNPKLCLASVIHFYELSTKDTRPSDTDLIILTVKKPIRPISTQRLSKWIKMTLTASGIDTVIFSGYSTRHAATSAAHRAGVSIEMIRSTAG
ncbi:hypothetical protein NQ314_005014 [Rhamnusium bicolor]|uniref:Tyr recombinase domain-containing protein n=1 Tax=Rhamnusium bicolor TaxID=1586634 RepID=A0AAV8ZI19_9CUCU|nr:hypothetical protein NQ314_005014 [Rhamnusium bicolor]